MNAQISLLAITLLFGPNQFSVTKLSPGDMECVEKSKLDICTSTTLSEVTDKIDQVVHTQKEGLSELEHGPGTGGNTGGGKVQSPIF